MGKAIKNPENATLALNSIRTMIDAGRFPADGRLPTERELSKTIGVGRRAVQRALEALEAEGIVWRHLCRISASPRGPSCRTGWAHCSTGSNCRAASRAGSRTNYQAGSASASPLPAPWPANPKLIIADEAVSALDVSVQAQVLNLMMELQADLGVSFLFISHDMAVVERVAHRVGVIYLSRIVEIGSRAQVFENPQHSYTKSLMTAVPIADPTRRTIHDDQEFKPIPSPVFPVGHRPQPSVYHEAAPGHLVLND